MDNAFVTARLTSPHFDCSQLQIRTLHGREAISRPFRFEVEVVVLDPGELVESAVVGADATLVFEQGGAEARSIHGMVAELDDLLDADLAFRSYRLVLVPHAFRLTMVETQEVFLELSVPDILRAKLERVGLGAQDVDYRLTATYPVREFVVQYRETDLAFVSRLTEHLGVGYYFEHDSGFDKLVFFDGPGAHRPIDGEEKVEFRMRGERGGVHRIERRALMMPAAFVTQDYNYRSPQMDLTASYESPHGNAGGVVEYGGHHKNPGEGAALARIRAEARETECRFFHGEADVCRFRAGATFELTDHPRLQKARFLLVEVEHHLVQTVMSTATGDEHAYRVTFRAVDAVIPYRPPRVTPKPRIHGFVTATVEAELGEFPGM